MRIPISHPIAANPAKYPQFFLFSAFGAPFMMRYHATCLSTFLLATAEMAAAQVPPKEADTARFSVEAAVQVTHEASPFWGLAQQFSPTANYKSSYNWVEGYVKPGVKASKDIGAGLELYGGASALASYTGGTDLFVQGASGRVLLEDAYAGLRRKRDDDHWGYTLSAGAQPYRLAHGFLLSNGAGNGFERGAAVLAPRKAWGMTALAQVESKFWSADVFYLDANELKSSDTGTKLAGANVAWTPQPGQQFGLAHFRVMDSTAPYPQAPIKIIDGGRDGLQTTDLHWRYEPTEGPMAGFSTLGELAVQRNARIQMKAKGWGMEVGYRFATLPFTPKLSYSARYFSGDDPFTPHRLERFDGLFYDGSPQTWSSGGNGSFAFYNSNLVVHRFRVDLVVSPQDFVNVSIWNVKAAQANSPVQYGQAARLNVANNGQFGLVSGFPNRSLSTELYFEHTRVLSQHLFLTWGVALALPQDGIKAIVPNGGKKWVGALANLTYRYY